MPFLLNPSMGDEGEDLMEHLTKKYGPGAAARALDPNSSLYVMGRKVGIEFATDRKMVATQRAHALVEHLKTKNNESANQFMEDLFRSFFVEGQDINQEALLAEMAQKYGVDAKEATSVMDAKHRHDIMVKDRQIKSKYGVSGVPFFMIHPNEGSGPPVAFSGAYPVDVIAEQLEEAAE
jgi:predicted DsbA family dithiol-disulfide isomerase